MLWLAVALPLLVVVQIALVTLRNIARRRIHQHHLVDLHDDGDGDGELAAIIADALDAVIGGRAPLRDRDAILAAADAAARRVVGHTTLTERERQTLHRELQTALVEALEDRSGGAARLEPVDLRRVVVEDLP